MALPTQGSMAGGQHMSQNPWADLPDYLITIVLARLPLVQVLQLQTLSKSWRSVIRSPAFSLLQSEAHNSSESWLVMERTPFEGLEAYVAYCPTSGRWFQFPLDREMIFYDFTPKSAGGLICYLTGSTVLVHDVLRRTSKKLPSPPGGSGVLRNSLYDMVANSATGSYQVILSNPSSYPRYEYLEVYDSRSGLWKVGQGIHSGNFTGSVLNGALFELVEGEGTLAAYSGELDTWSKVKVPEPSCLFEGGSLDLISKVVIKCKDRLLLLAGLVPEAVLLHDRSTQQIPLQGFGVWELQYLRQDTASWVEVARTPTEYWQGLYSIYRPSSRYTCKFHIANENLIFMTGFLFATRRKKCKIQWLPLVYDLALDSWHRLPGHNGDDSVDYLGVFTFYPKLNAMI